MRTRTLVLVSAAVLALPGAAQAAAPWRPAQTLSRTAGDRPAAAIGGQSMVAWAAQRPGGGSGLYAVRRVSGARFGAPRALYTDARSMDGAAVQIDRRGNALVAFRRLIERNHRIASLTVRRGGGRTGPISLSGPGSSAYSPTFGTPPAGTLAERPTLAWWRRETDRVQTSRAVSGRLLVSATSVLPGAPDAEYALHADGTLLGAGATASEVALGTLGSAGFTVQRLAGAPGPFRSAAVATGAGATAAVAWRAYTARPAPAWCG